MLSRVVVVLALIAGAAVPANAGLVSAAWFDAARDGDVSALRKLAGAQARTAVHAVDDRGYDALILAAYHDRTAAIRWLLARGASTCTSDRRGFTALMGAVFRGHVTSVRMLIARPCGADHVTPTGQTPLMLAALFGRVEIVKLLLAHGANPARIDASGFDARRLAEAQGHQEILALLDAARR